jgi:hypothetical protein
MRSIANRAFVVLNFDTKPVLAGWKLFGDDV